ncbi:MAG: hypothetical protein H0W50_00550 [Parachlamydiaceae bacterium]|nr:hypothetical protein [Parachlamydiaceae bacterium]
MEVPKDHHLTSVVQYLESTTEISDEGINNVVKKIFENQDLLKLNGFNFSALFRIQIKLLQLGVSKNDKVINLIDGVYADYSGKIDKQIKDMENEISFFEKLGSIKELGNNEYLRAYYNRFTWTYDIRVNQNYLSKTLKESSLSPLYGMYDQPKDLTDLILLIKKDLKRKLDGLLVELQKGGASVDNLNKGLNLLISINHIFNNVDETLNKLQKSPLYDNETVNLNLVKTIHDFDEFQESINNSIFDLTGLIYLAEENNDELNALREIFNNTQNERREVEGSSFNIGIREEKSILKYSDYLSRKSVNKLINIEFNQLENDSSLNLKNIDNIYISEVPVTYIEGALNDFVTSKFDFNPELDEIISKMISAEMYQDMLNATEVQSKFKHLSPLKDLAKVAEIFMDEYHNLEITLKMGCGYSLSAGNDIKEFFLVKRSFTISMDDLKSLTKKKLAISFNDFKIVEYISPQVKVDSIEFIGRKYEKNVIRQLLKKYSPTQNWGKVTAKMLFEKAKPFVGIDDVKVFKDTLQGVNIEMNPVPLSNEEGEFAYIVPKIVSLDFRRSTLIKFNNEEVYANFKPALLSVNRAYAKIAAGFGEDPENAMLASTTCLAITQAVAADIVENMSVYDIDDIGHIQTWREKFYEIGIDSKNILTILSKSIVYETLSGKNITELGSGYVIYRKFQIPVAELRDAIKNNNMDLLVNLVAEHRISPSFLIRESYLDMGKDFKILNSEDRADKLNKKDALELLENFGK